MPAARSDKSASTKKRDALIEAATRAFSSYGLRRTSMELLAREARVAKGTAYAYFADKDVLFAAVCDVTARRLFAVADEAAAAVAKPRDRVTAALVAKFSLVHDLVHGSPHARELLDAAERLGSKPLEKSRRAFVDLLAKNLVKAGAPPERARAAARLLEQSCDGLGGSARSKAELARSVTLLAELVMNGLLGKRARRG